MQTLTFRTELLYEYILRARYGWRVIKTQPENEPVTKKSPVIAKNSKKALQIANFLHYHITVLVQYSQQCNRHSES